MIAGIYTIIGLTIGNVLWEIYMKKKRWDMLFERFYFQTVAIIAMYLIQQYLMR